MLYRIGAFKILHKSHRKTRVLESLLNKVAKSDSTSATSNERILQRVTSDFLQQSISGTSNEQILQQVTSNFTMSNFCNE